MASLPIQMLMGLLFFTSVVCASPDNLNDYRWKKRVVLVFGEPSAIKNQIDAWSADNSRFAERDVVIETVLGDSAERLQKQFDVHSGRFTVVLLGKDGGEKFRSAKPVDPEVLFQIIDAMPMRQQEMRESR